MQVVLAQDFVDAALDLAPREGRQALEFVAQFRRNPAHPGLSLERLNRDVWSARVNQDVRAILHKAGDTWTLLHVDHHDQAYHWAERRRIELHPVTRELQVVQVVHREVERTVERGPRLLAAHSDAYLLSLGVPQDWLTVVREVADEDQLLEVCAKLPVEVGERLVELSTGRLVTPPPPPPPDRSWTEGAEVRRRYFVLDGDAELAALLEAPMAKWIAFLHPSQRKLATGRFQGPVKVTGSAGTGKTVVAMHRARHLAQQGKRVLLTTYSKTLPDNLRRNLRLLCTTEELAMLTVGTVHSTALAVARKADSAVEVLPENHLRLLLERHAALVPEAPDVDFLLSEWDAVVAAQGIVDWEGYRSARRQGRGRPLSVKQRRAIWRIFEGALQSMAADRAFDFPSVCRIAREHLEAGRVERPYDAVVVDEVQDLEAQELRFLAALAGEGADRLMLLGDGGQRIFGRGLSLRSLGIETRGRSHVLRINYRTTEQIRRYADRILGDAVDDLDGETESRRGTRSLLRGPEPRLLPCATAEEQTERVVGEIAQLLRSGLAADEVAVFARRGASLDPLEEALHQRGIPSHRLSERGGSEGAVQLGTMHRAKGLEFKQVFVVDCSAGELPSPMALRAAVDPADREAVVENEKRLLYVALTRARDEAAVSWVGGASPFVPQGVRAAV